MAALVVVDPFTRTSHTLKNVDLGLPLKDFKQELFKEKDIATSELEFMFLGEILNDENRSLQSYGVQNNTTVYMLKKLAEDIETDAPCNGITNAEEAKALLLKAKNPVYKQMLKKLMKNKESVEKLLSENEVLRKDRTIIALLRDPDLSLAVLESLTPLRMVNEYPMLGTALKIVLSNISIADSIGRQSLLQGSHEEEGDYEGMDPALLAQAELMAANEESIQQNQQQQSSSVSGQQQQQQQQRARQISAADLANALSFASMNQSSVGTPATQSTGNTSNNEAPSVNFDEALAQMQATGITDEALSRRALQMSGGNVELALNFIFEGALDN